VNLLLFVAVLGARNDERPASGLHTAEFSRLLTVFIPG